MFKPRYALTAIGLIVAAAGTACGYLLPVGKYCPGACGLEKFSEDAEQAESGMWAMAALATCHTNANQYAPLWTAVISAGVLLFAAGLIWSLAAMARTARSTPKHSATAAPAGRRRSSSAEGNRVLNHDRGQNEHDVYDRRDRAQDRGAARVRYSKPPLVDGNKRMSWRPMVLFLRLNGRRHCFDTEAAFDPVFIVALGRLSLEESAARIAGHLIVRS